MCNCVFGMEVCRGLCWVDACAVCAGRRLCGIVGMWRRGGGMAAMYEGLWCQGMSTG